MSARQKFAEPASLSVQDLPKLFSPSYAGSLEANYRLDIRGDDGDLHSWTFTVFHGKCGLLPGDEIEADVVFVLDPPTLEELVTGLNDVATLYQKRKLGLKGKVDLAIRFPQLFSRLR